MHVRGTLARRRGHGLEDGVDARTQGRVVAGNHIPHVACRGSSPAWHSVIGGGEVDDDRVTHDPDKRAPLLLERAELEWGGCLRVESMAPRRAATVAITRRVIDASCEAKYSL